MSNKHFSTENKQKTVQNVKFNIGSPKNQGHSSYKLIVRLESFNHPTEPPFYGFAGRVFHHGSKRIIKTYDEPQYFNPENEIPYLESFFKEKYAGCKVFKAQICDALYPERGGIVKEWNGTQFITTSEPKPQRPKSITQTEKFQFRAWLPMSKNSDSLKCTFFQTPIFDPSTGEYLEGLTLFSLMKQVQDYVNQNGIKDPLTGKIYGGKKEYHITERNLPDFGWFDTSNCVPLYNGRGRNSRAIETYAQLFAQPTPQSYETA